MTTNGIAVLNYLKNVYPNEKSKDEIVAATGFSAGVVQAALTGFGSLKRMNMVEERSETIELEPAVPATETTRGRKAKMKTIHYFVLNEAGLAYDAEAAEAEKAAKKEAEKAAKKAAKYDA